MPGLLIVRLVAAARFELTFGPPVPKFRDGPENVSPTSALLALLVDRKSRRPGEMPGLRSMRLVAGAGFEPATFGL